MDSSPRYSRAPLFTDKLFDRRFGYAVGAFANMAVTNYALFVDQHDGWPSPDAVAVPNVKVVILHHRELDTETRGRFLHFGQGFFPGKFRRMDADDGQPGLFELIMPTPQLRDDVSTVDSAIGPKLDENNSPFEARDVERFTVDPVFAGELGSRCAVGERRAGTRPSRPKRQGENESR